MTGNADGNQAHQRFAPSTDGACAARAGGVAEHSQDELSRIFSLSIDMLCVAGLDGFFRRVSPSFERTLGFSAEEFLARPFIEFVHPDDRDRTLAELDRLSTGRPTIQFENRYRCKDGTYRWISWTACPVPAEGLVYAAARDMTEYRKLGEAVQFERDRLMNLLSVMEDGVCIVSPDHVIEYVNAAMERTFGPLRGRRCYEYAPGRCEPCPWCRNEQVFRGETVRWEWYSAAHDRHFDVFEAPLRNPDGQVSKIELFHDITARKRAEEQARHHQAMLAHVSRLNLVGEMAAGLAHELNQPLFAIVSATEGCLRLLRSDATNREELIEAMEIAAGQAKRAGAILHRIRRLVQRRQPDRTEVNLGRLLRDTIGLFHREARERRIAVRLDVADDLPPIRADAVQIEQVVLNLVRNSMDAMSGSAADGRVITLRAAVGEEGAVVVGVQDNGPGLAPETIERVFDPFFTTKANGLGLGLAISRSIVESHGGRLWATPVPEGGVTFQFTLPTDSGPPDVRCDDA